MKNKKALFFLSGSISCYKACEVISGLTKQSVQVQCVASPSTLEFIGAATIEGLTGKPLLTSEFQAGNSMDHIHWMRDSDIFITCPATSNTINQYASGTGGILTTFFLAYDFQKPFLIYPAMNQAMYKHPVTQASIERLNSMGVKVRKTDHGELACGETGPGRLLDPSQIIEDILEHLEVTK